MPRKLRINPIDEIFAKLTERSRASSNASDRSMRSNTSNKSSKRTWSNMWFKTKKKRTPLRLSEKSTYGQLNIVPPHQVIHDPRRHRSTDNIILPVIEHTEHIPPINALSTTLSLSHTILSDLQTLKTYIINGVITRSPQHVYKLLLSVFKCILYIIYIWLKKFISNPHGTLLFTLFVFYYSYYMGYKIHTTLYNTIETVFKYILFPFALALSRMGKPELYNQLRTVKMAIDVTGTTIMLPITSGQAAVETIITTGISVAEKGNELVTLTTETAMHARELAEFVRSGEGIALMNRMVSNAVETSTEAMLNATKENAAQIATLGASIAALSALTQQQNSQVMSTLNQIKRENKNRMEQLTDQITDLSDTIKQVENTQKRIGTQTMATITAASTISLDNNRLMLGYVRDMSQEIKIQNQNSRTMLENQETTINRIEDAKRDASTALTQIDGTIQLLSDKTSAITDYNKYNVGLHAVNTVAGFVGPLASSVVGLLTEGGLPSVRLQQLGKGRKRFNKSKKNKKNKSRRHK